LAIVNDVATAAAEVQGGGAGERQVVWGRLRGRMRAAA